MKKETISGDDFYNSVSGTNTVGITQTNFCDSNSSFFQKLDDGCYNNIIFIMFLVCLVLLATKFIYWFFSIILK